MRKLATLLTSLALLLMAGCGAPEVETPTPTPEPPGALSVDRVRFEKNSGTFSVWGSSRLDPGTPLTLTLRAHGDDAAAPSLSAEAVVAQGGVWELQLILSPEMAAAIRQGQSFQVQAMAKEDPQLSDVLWFSVTEPPASD